MCLVNNSFQCIRLGKELDRKEKGSITTREPYNFSLFYFQLMMSANIPENDNTTLLDEKIEIGEPELYKVVLHNDDYTSMEFVVFILTSIFHKSVTDATEIMLDVHNNGTGIAGVYTREICEMKVEQVHGLAEENEYPLRCTMEIA